jgi:hypothetical protein
MVGAWFAWLALLCGLCCAQNLPSSGLYISFSDAAISNIAEVVTADIVNDINGYNGWPTISGSSSSVKYVFSNWKVAIAAVYPQWKYAGTNELLIGWQQFNFTIQSNYHICSTSWPNPCEDGNMYVYTTDTHTSLYLDTVLDLTQSPPFINVTATDLDFTNNGIQVYVHCSNTFCLIPVNDIANAIAQNFVSLFTAGVAKAANTALQESIAKFRTEFSFSNGLGLNFQSNWWILPDSSIILVPTAGGFYTNVSGAISNPPFVPEFTPPLDYLGNPNEDFNIVITEYFFTSLTWALGSLGFFNTQITSSDVPAQSPVKLNTNDDFFLQVAPGLSAFPNMDITITTKLNAVSIPTLDTSGLHVWGTDISFDFTLSNSSYSHHGWTLDNVFNIDFQIAASASGNLVEFTTTISNFSATAELTETDVGNVTADAFPLLYQLLESQIKVPGFAIHLPEAISASNPSVQPFDHFIGVGVDFSYSKAKLEPLEKISHKIAFKTFS